MNRSSLAIVVAAVMLCACGGGGGKRGVAQQSSTAAPAHEEPGYLRFASADTAKTSTANADGDPQSANDVPAAGTLLNLLLAGAVIFGVKSGFGRKGSRPS